MDDRLSTLYKVRALFDYDPNKWTTKALARNGQNRAVSPRAESACSWCLGGAIALFDRDVDFDVDPHEMYDNGKGYAEALGITGGSIEAHNDALTHAQIMLLLDFAIERLENNE